MEFLHHGDALHPSPSDVELAVASHGPGSAAAVIEDEKRKRSTWRKSLSPGGSATKGSGAVEESFVGAPQFHSEIVQAKQVCEGPLWAVSVSPRGLVACGGSDGLVTVAFLSAPRELGGGDWRLPREALLLEEVKLGGHGGAVFDVAFGPAKGAVSDEEEEILVSVSSDATARLWKGGVGTTELSCVMVFSHAAAVCCCAFLDGDSFATGGYDRNVRIRAGQG